jgi:hypothetical protein
MAGSLALGGGVSPDPRQRRIIEMPVRLEPIKE